MNLKIFSKKNIINKYIKDDLKYLISDVINNQCKDFKENVFYKQVKEIDDETNDFGTKSNYEQKNKRLKIYNGSDNEDENEKKK